MKATPKPILLCVDDDLELLDTLEVLLARSFPACSVVAATDGGDALRLVSEMHGKGADLALVITDQLLGDTTGTALLKRLQAYYPDSGNVILTGHAAVESAVECILLRIDDYLEKPVDERELRRTVRPLIERHLLRSEQARIRALARKAERQMSTLLELAFRDVERPLAIMLGDGGAKDQARIELSRAQDRLNFLWRVLRDEGLGRQLKLDYFSAQELVDAAKTIWTRSDNQGLETEAVPHLATFIRPERLAIYGDRRMCHIALEQVLHNAWRFSTEGTPVAIQGRGPNYLPHDGDLLDTPTPIVQAQLKAGRAVISVTNTGRLDQSNYLRIQLALGRDRTRHSLPGAGIVVAQTLLEASGGRLMFEGAPGQDGVTFHLALPAAKM